MPPTPLAWAPPLEVPLPAFDTSGKLDAVDDPPRVVFVETEHKDGSDDVPTPLQPVPHQEIKK